MPIPPFVVSDHGDVYVYDGIAAMRARIEAADASDMDLFDSTGRPIHVVVNGRAWGVDESRVDSPEPERLVEILRTYFGRLPEEFSGYRERAAEIPSLSELLILRQELAREPAPGIWAKLFGRSWG